MRGRPASGEDRLQDLTKAAQSEHIYVLYKVAELQGLTPTKFAKLLRVKIPTLANYTKAKKPRSATVDYIAKKLSISRAVLELGIRARCDRLSAIDFRALERLALTTKNFPNLAITAVRRKGETPASFSHASPGGQRAALRAYALAAVGLDTGKRPPPVALVDTLAKHSRDRKHALAMNEAMKRPPRNDKPLSELGVDFFRLAAKDGVKFSDEQHAFIDDCLLVLSNVPPNTLPRLAPQTDPNDFVGPLKRFQALEAPAHLAGPRKRPARPARRSRVDDGRARR